MSSRLLSSVILAVGSFTVGAPVLADSSCPDRLSYTNGNWLKLGTNYYYPNGNVLARDSNVAYPNGNWMILSNNVYYANGNTLIRDGNVAYPNGNWLRLSNNLYYANGNVMKRDANFAYRNGNWARLNGTLYREDGQTSGFPVELTETIDSYGRVIADVRANDQDVEIYLDDLFAGDATVGGSRLNVTDASFNMKMRIAGGGPGEEIELQVGPGGVLSCVTVGGRSRDFTLDRAAARIEVHVNSGYDPDQVRAALEQALRDVQ